MSFLSLDAKGLKNRTLVGKIPEILLNYFLMMTMSGIAQSEYAEYVDYMSNKRRPQSYSFMKGQRVLILYIYECIVNHHNSVLIKHNVFDHLSPKDIVGNQVHFEPC